jgi:hypothetical protein
MNTEPIFAFLAGINTAAAPPRTMITLAKCSVCGHITDDFVKYGSFFLREEYPLECIAVCSSECMDTAQQNIEAETWKTPELTASSSLGKAHHDIKRPRVGYDPQPTQDELIKELTAKQSP